MITHLWKIYNVLIPKRCEFNVSLFRESTRHVHQTTRPLLENQCEYYYYFTMIGSVEVQIIRFHDSLSLMIFDIRPQPM